MAAVEPAASLSPARLNHTEAHMPLVKRAAVLLCCCALSTMYLLTSTLCYALLRCALQENDRGDEKIRQLIDTLDMRKDEAIERTFKGVAKQFRDIFAQVGAGGRAGGVGLSRRAELVDWAARCVRACACACVGECGCCGSDVVVGSEAPACAGLRRLAGGTQTQSGRACPL